MSELPKELSIDNLAAMTVPLDMTVGEVIKFLMTRPHFQFIKNASRYPDLVRIRILADGGRPAPDDMTIAEMREKVRKKELHIVIDDGEGGELVS